LAALGHAASAALAHAIAMGDALNTAKKLIGHGHWQDDWEDWVSKECGGLSVRSARNYMRLANHRTVLEAKRQRAADLSIRAALRLIGPAKTARPRKPAPALKISLWNSATAEERKAFIGNIKPVDLLAAISEFQRAEFERRIGDHVACSLQRQVRELKQQLKQAVPLTKTTITTGRAA
jgi:hypothetical protein